MISSLHFYLPYLALALVLVQCALFVIRPDFLFRRKTGRRFRFRASGPAHDRVVADLRADVRRLDAAQLSLAELLKPRPPR